MAEEIKNQPVEKNNASQAATEAPDGSMSARSTSDERTVVTQQNAVPNQAAYLGLDQKKKSHLLRRIVMFFVWVVVIGAVIVLALMISAWLTGFKTASGAPDVLAMLEWIKNYFNLTR